MSGINIIPKCNPILMVFSDKYIIRYIINIIGEHSILPLLLTSKIFLEAYTFGKNRPIISNYENLCSNETILRWIINLGCREILRGSRLNCAFAKNNNLNMLNWSREMSTSFDWDENVFISAIKNNHLEIVQWLRTLNPPCPWSEKVMAVAIKHNKFEIVKWLYENGCPWDETCFDVAVMTGNLSLLKWLKEQMQNHSCEISISSCACAVLNGHLDVLKWLRNQNPSYPWNEQVFVNACIFGDLDIIKWMRNQDTPCPWSSIALNKAIKCGHIDLVKWLIEHNCPTDNYSLVNACEENQFELLVWMHENHNIALNSMCYMGAAINGNLLILQWLHRNFCPWDDDILINAILSEDINTFMWVWNNINITQIDDFDYLLEISKNDIIKNHLYNYVNNA